MAYYIYVNSWESLSNFISSRFMLLPEIARETLHFFLAPKPYLLYAPLFSGNHISFSLVTNHLVELSIAVWAVFQNTARNNFSNNSLSQNKVITSGGTLAFFAVPKSKYNPLLHPKIN